jgi:transglutaminase-like putative cysteine protease
MIRLVVVTVLLIFHIGNAGAQTASRTSQSQSRLKAFADSIAQGAPSSYEKAEKVVRWLANNFDWTATDYQKRTVEEIMARKGGNCNELAMVTIALLKELNLQMRKVREINIHKESATRRENARQKILERGQFA